MRYVEKPTNPPTGIDKEIDEATQKFIDGAAEHKENVRLYDRKASDKLNQDWFQKSQKILSYLYNDKCAFCERMFSNEAENTKVTVEHFRPKNKMLYYWLAVEWTNLLPTCKGCNGFKEDKFPLSDEARKIKTPFIPDNQLDESLFDAKILNQLENPLLLNPEIDNSNEFLYFDENAELKAVNNNPRALETINLLKLNDAVKRENLVQKRRKVLDDIRKDLEFQTKKIYEAEQQGKIIDDFLLELVYDLHFQKIISFAYNKKVEFSLLAFYILHDFENLISKPISKEIAKNVDIEFQERTASEINDLIKTAFLSFLEKSTAK